MFFAWHPTSPFKTKSARRSLTSARRFFITVALTGLIAPCISAAPFPSTELVQTPNSVVVATDGTGDFKSIQEAINAAPQLTDAKKPWTIWIKPGTYHELIYVMREKRFIRLVGEDADKTVITNSLYAGQAGLDGLPMGTFRTPTVWIDADDFRVESLSIVNSAGPVGQAVALRVDGDRGEFFHCHLVGWQDTLLVNRGRHYFQGCKIVGAIDFIFGGATAFFEACEIVCLGDGYITAASTLPYDAFGFVFSHCAISSPDSTVRTYLGRPWRAFSSVTFLSTRMDAVILPAGWDNWDRPERETTTRYAEFKNFGTGAATSARVPWTRRLKDKEAALITQDLVLGGIDHWHPHL